jgi:DNA sulfur modification protein DndD
MLFKSITLHNLKSYEGTHKISGLTENLSEQNPIILMGGLNGAGKTTLLEAILLCLYGKWNEDTLWPSKGAKLENYDFYMYSVLNENVKSKGYVGNVWIEMELDDVNIEGIPHNFFIKRRWEIDIKGKSIKDEKLELFTSDRRGFDYIPKENWENFLKDELIPYPISQFFFFDGEKIQDFAKDSDKEFARSLKHVLGISMYSTLYEDVGHVRGKILTQFNKDKEAVVEYKELEIDIEKARTEIHSHQYEIETLTEEVENWQNRIEEIEKETFRQTRIKAETQEEYEKIKEELHHEKIEIESKLSAYINNTLPFIMLYPTGENLINQLKSEEKLKEWKAAEKTLRPKIDKVVNRLFDDEAPPPPDLTFRQKEFYSLKLERILKEILIESKPEKLESIKLIHNLSSDDSNNIISKIKNIRIQVLNNLANDIEKYRQIEYKLSEIRRARTKKSSPEVNALFEEKGRVEQKIRGKQEEINNKEIKIRQLEEEIVNLKKQLTQKEKRIKSTEEQQKQLDYCHQMKKALEEFQNKFQAKKVDELEEYTLQMLGNLGRKQEWIKRVKIDPKNNFEIKLYDHRNRAIDKTKLSAGEKELFAISLIWALCQSTDKKIPIVIDTPLSRFDSIHRSNVVKNYYPQAGVYTILKVPKIPIEK